MYMYVCMYIYIYIHTYIDIQDVRSWAEYGWKPHRVVFAQKCLSPASFDWHMRETRKGKVSSNSRLQTILFPY